jgi:cytochrome c oxidase subunit II
MYIDRFERYWIIAVSATLGAFLAALLVATLVFGVRLPAPVGRVDPLRLEETEFAAPGLRDMGAGRYNLTIVAKMWNFDVGQPVGQPAEVRVPAGSEVMISVTSKDVTHGFFVEEHDVNLMLLPGQIARANVTFRRPGTYHIICHEYCGPGHQTMYGTIIVE